MPSLLSLVFAGLMGVVVTLIDVQRDLAVVADDVEELANERLITVTDLQLVLDAQNEKHVRWENWLTRSSDRLNGIERSVRLIEGRLSAPEQIKGDGK